MRAKEHAVKRICSDHGSRRKVAAPAKIRGSSAWSNIRRRFQPCRNKSPPPSPNPLAGQRAQVTFGVLPSSIRRTFPQTHPIQPARTTPLSKGFQHLPHPRQTTGRPSHAIVAPFVACARDIAPDGRRMVLSHHPKPIHATLHRTAVAWYCRAIRSLCPRHCTGRPSHGIVAPSLRTFILWGPPFRDAGRTG
jgi:hypothetical protein